MNNLELVPRYFPQEHISYNWVNYKDFIKWGYLRTNYKHPDKPTTTLVVIDNHSGGFPAITIEELYKILNTEPQYEIY
jgi:hypothetical protein